MDKHLFFLIATVCWATMCLQAWADTDELEVQALQDLYMSLNKPTRLNNWKLEGGKPCQETWIGVQCSGSSIINLKLHGLGLTGNLGVQLCNLKSLKHLDLSANNIQGSIPYSLPPNLTNLNLAENKFSESITYSFEKIKHLHHLNLSHNFFTGPLGDVFNGLENLKLMDLSFNSLTGDLPTSFESLKNLTGLFLQNNQFTGSVIVLANLSLSTLNIEDNHFSGVIPEHFQTIPNLRFGGNKFNTGPDYLPWRFPSNTMATEPNISSPPATNLSAFETHPNQITQVHNKKKTHAAGIVLLMIGGLTLVATLIAISITVIKRSLRRVTPPPPPPPAPRRSIADLRHYTTLGILNDVGRSKSDDERRRLAQNFENAFAILIRTEKEADTLISLKKDNMLPEKPIEIEEFNPRLRKLKKRLEEHDFEVVVVE